MRTGDYLFQWPHSTKKEDPERKNESICWSPIAHSSSEIEIPMNLPPFLLPHPHCLQQMHILQASVHRLRSKVSMGQAASKRHCSQSTGKNRFTAGTPCPTSHPSSYRPAPMGAQVVTYTCLWIFPPLLESLSWLWTSGTESVSKDLEWKL